jgi:hypothetical protein
MRILVFRVAKDAGGLQISRNPSIRNDGLLVGVGSIDTGYFVRIITGLVDRQWY